MTAAEGGPRTAAAGPRAGPQPAAAGAWALDPDEWRVLMLLYRQPGPPMPVPMPELAAAAGVSTRELQEIVHRLVVQHGVPICSSSGRGLHGYWVPRSAAEAAAGRRNLIGRIRSLARRLRALDAAAAREFTRQLALEMAGDGPGPWVAGPGPPEERGSR